MKPPTLGAPTQPVAAPTPGRVLNLPLLLATAAVCLVAFVILNFLRGSRVASHAGTLLAAAAVAEGNSDWQTATDCLRRYLSLQPNDLDAMVRLGEALEKWSERREHKLGAIEAYGEVLYHDPDRSELWLRLAELQLFIGAPSDALTSVGTYLSQKGRAFDALRLRAAALDAISSSGGGLQKVKLPEVVRAYEDALELNPGHVETAVRLAQLFRQNAAELARSLTFMSEKDLLESANLLIDTMVQKADQRTDALLARFQYRREYGLLPPGAAKGAIDPDLAEALQLSPGNVEVRLAVARQLQESVSRTLVLADTVPTDVDRRILTSAAEHFQFVVESKPEEPRAYRGLATVRWLADQRPQAIAALEAGLKYVGRDAPTLNLTLADFHLATGAWESAWDAINRAEQSLAAVRAADEIPEEALAPLRALVHLKRAQWYLSADDRKKRDYLRAADTLRLVSDLSGMSAYAIEAFMQLGRCRMALGQWDLAASAFEKVALARTGDIEAKLLQAETLRRAGRVDEAIRAYRQALSNAAGTPWDRAGAWLALAEAEFAHQMVLPPEKQHWDGLNEAVGKARKLAPSSPEADMLEIRSLAARGAADRKAALERLQAAEKAFGQTAEFWERACPLYLVLGQLTEVERGIARLEQLTGKKSAYLRSQLELAKGRAGAARALIANAPAAADSRARLSERYEMALRSGRLAEASDLLRELTTLRPDDLQLTFRRVELAIATEDLAELQACEESLQKLEGEAGSHLRYCRFFRALLGSKVPDTDAARAAAILADEIVRLRPTWNRAWYCLGRAAEARGQVSEAINAYRDAYRLGDRRGEVVRRLVGLLVLRGGSEEARALVADLAEASRQSVEIVALEAYVGLSTGKAEDVVPLVQAALSRSTVPRARAELKILLAQALMATKRPDRHQEARTLLSEAGGLAAADPFVWLAWLHWALSVDELDGAAMALAGLRNSVELIRGSSASVPAAWRALVVARCVQLEGNIRAAEKYYRTALELAADTAIRRTFPVTALVSDDLSPTNESVKITRLRFTPENVRRTLGVLLATSEDSQDQADGLELMGSDARLQALAALYRGGSDNRNKGRALLESIPAAERHAGDELVLARLSRHDGRADQALAHYESAKEKSPTLDILLEFAGYTFERRDPVRAAAAIAALKQLTTQREMLIPLEMRLLAIQGQMPAAVDLALRYDADAEKQAKTPAARLQRARIAAGWLAQLDARQKADELMQNAIKQDPNNRLALAEWLSGQPNLGDEALAHCLSALEKEDPGKVGYLACQIGLRRQLSPQQAQRLEQLIAQAQAARPYAPDLASAIALLRERQGRTDEAIRICQDVLQRQPDSVALLNNLAWLLAAYEGKFDDALRAIDRAIALGGPKVEALDTKGVVLMGLDRPHAAVCVLEACVDQTPSAAVYLHLAEAYGQAGWHADSRRAYSRAVQLGLVGLTPRDEAVRQRMEQTVAAN